MNQSRHAKFFTPMTLRLIVEYLGEPVAAFIALVRMAAHGSYEPWAADFVPLQHQRFPAPDQSTACTHRNTRRILSQVRIIL